MKRIIELLKGITPTGSMGSQVVKSLMWVFGQNAVGRVVTLSMLIILARLIGPAELGLVGIALLVMSGLQSFTNIGLNGALIYQKEENVDSYLDTVWILEIGRGLLIAAVMILSAPLVAMLFNEPRAEMMVQVLAIAPVLRSFRNPGIVYFDKHLDFHKDFLYKFVANAVRFVVSVGYALVEPTAWAYVVGFLAGSVTQFGLSYVIHDFRPWFRFDRDAAWELIDYGKWLTGVSILTFLTTEGDDAFVGWLLGPAALGLYQYAYRFSNAPATEFTQIISRVMFPAFSKMQDDTARLRSVFLTTFRMTAFVSFPACFGIAAVTPVFVRAFLGPDWTGMILAMQILAGYGLMRAVTKTFGPVWKAIGRPDYVTKLSALRVVLMAALIVPATQQFGIVGAATATATSLLIRDAFYAGLLYYWYRIQPFSSAMVRPLLGVAILVPVGYFGFVELFDPAFLSVTVAGLLFLLIYGPLVIVLGGVEPADIEVFGRFEESAGVDFEELKRVVRYLNS
jgi:PST family polysaccharide transporter/lipopolysaccharide exporter